MLNHHVDEWSVSGLGFDSKSSQVDKMLIIIWKQWLLFAYITAWNGFTSNKYFFSRKSIIFASEVKPKKERNSEKSNLHSEDATNVVSNDDDMWLMTELF